jgi:predicted enzyme related to lactoylglutathione lyase
MAINGIHAVLYTRHPDGVRAFLKDVLELPFVDAGNGRLFFAAPVTELGIHETEDEPSHELFLMCDDVQATIAQLKERGIETATPIVDRGWGLVTELILPGGDRIGLYEPRHARPR